MTHCEPRTSTDGVARVEVPERRPGDDGSLDESCWAALDLRAVANWEQLELGELMALPEPIRRQVLRALRAKAEARGTQEPTLLLVADVEEV